MEPLAVAIFDRSVSRGPAAVDLSSGGGSRFVRARTQSIGARGRGGYLLLSLAGVVGFVGLLLAAHVMPAQAEPLRIAALAWFLGFGVMRLALRSGRRGR
jgi:hypothetical protein